MLASEAEDAAGASQLMLLSAADHTVAVRTSATATTGQRFRFAGPGCTLVPPSPSSSAVLASEVRAIALEARAGRDAALVVLGGAASGKHAALLGLNGGDGALALAATALLERGPGQPPPPAVHLSWRGVVGGRSVDMLHRSAAKQRVGGNYIPSVTAGDEQHLELQRPAHAAAAAKRAAAAVDALGTRPVVQLLTFAITARGGRRSHLRLFVLTATGVDAVATDAVAAQVAPHDAAAAAIAVACAGEPPEAAALTTARAAISVALLQASRRLVLVTVGPSERCIGGSLRALRCAATVADALAAGSCAAGAPPRPTRAKPPRRFVAGSPLVEEGEGEGDEGEGEGDDAPPKPPEEAAAPAPPPKLRPPAAKPPPKAPPTKPPPKPPIARATPKPLVTTLPPNPAPKPPPRPPKAPAAAPTAAPAPAPPMPTLAELAAMSPSRLGGSPLGRRPPAAAPRDGSPALVRSQSAFAALGGGSPRSVRSEARSETRSDAGDGRSWHCSSVASSVAGGVAPTVEYRAAVVRTEEMVEAEAAAAAADAELHKLREELDATRRRVDDGRAYKERVEAELGRLRAEGEALSRAKRARAARAVAPPPAAAATARPRSAAEAAAELAKLRDEHALLRRRSDELTVTVQLSRDEAESLRQQLLAPHTPAPTAAVAAAAAAAAERRPPTAEELSRLLLENEKLEAELAAKADARRADLTRAAALKREVAAMKAQLGVALGTLQQRVADRGGGGGGALGPASLYAASPMLCSG